MKVYFSSSLRAQKYYKKTFDLIFKYIKSLGYSHTSDFLITADPNKYYKDRFNFEKFYKVLTAQMKKASVCVFEVSLHSLGIGFCVDLALQMGKPVVLLYKKGHNPIFFKGIRSEKLQLYEYQSDDDLKEVLKDALEIAKGMSDIRFTFFINSKINQFLTWIAKVKKVPRAVYLRDLIQEAMKKEGFK
ncbi:hypothetical protein ACFLZ1_01730 [Patescibacteria group bacterium]